MKKLLLLSSILIIVFNSNAQFTCYPDMSTLSETCIGAVTGDTTSFTLDTLVKFEYHNKRGFKHLKSSYKRKVKGSRLVFADKDGYIDAAPVDSLKSMLFTGTSSQVTLGDGTYGALPGSPTPNYRTITASTAYTPSGSRGCSVSVTMLVSNVLGIQAIAYLETSADGVTWTTRTYNTNGLNLLYSYSDQIFCFVPSGHRYRVRVVTSGAATITFPYQTLELSY